MDMKHYDGIMSWQAANLAEQMAIKANEMLDKGMSVGDKYEMYGENARFIIDYDKGHIGFKVNNTTLSVVGCETRIDTGLIYSRKNLVRDFFSDLNFYKAERVSL